MILLIDVREITQTNFTSIRPVGTALILAGRQTDRHDENNRCHFT